MRRGPSSVAKPKNGLSENPNISENETFSWGNCKNFVRIECMIGYWTRQSSLMWIVTCRISGFIMAGSQSGTPKRVCLEIEIRLERTHILKTWTIRVKW